MTTLGVPRACQPFQLGFDVYAPVTEALLQEATAKSFKWCGRYLETLTPEERDLIFRYGFGILPYTVAMVREPLTAVTGESFGIYACDRAAALDMPSLVHVAIDLEQPAAGSDVPAHVNAMSDRLLAKNRGAALYVGVPQPLTGAELFALRPNRYIKGGGKAEEPTCGWAALQLEPLEGIALGGIAVDVEVSKLDYEGRALVMWWPT